MSDQEVGRLIALGAGALFGAYQLYKFVCPKGEDHRDDQQKSNLSKKSIETKNHQANTNASSERSHYLGQNHGYVYESMNHGAKKSEPRTSGYSQPRTVQHDFAIGQHSRSDLESPRPSACSCCLFTDYYRDELMFANPSGHAPGCTKYKRNYSRSVRATTYEIQSTSYATEQPQLQSIEDLPFYNQPVRVIWSVNSCKKALKELRQHCSEFPVLGLDCEWYGWGPRPPVALLQLATHRGLCVLLRLCKMDKIPLALQELLSDGNIRKVGVEVARDMRYLYEDYQLEGRGALDLRPLAKRCAVPEPHGLARLAETSLGIKMDKAWQLSDWEADQLTEDQIKYAANDARVSIELFRVYAETLFPRSVQTSRETWIHKVVKNL